MGNYSQNPGQGQGKQVRPDPQKNPQQNPGKSGDKGGRDDQRRNSQNYDNNAK